MPAGTPHRACAGRAEAVRVFVNEAPMNIAAVDLEGRFIAASERFQASFQVSLENIVGRAVTRFLDDADESLAPAKEALARGAPRYVAVRGISQADGRLQWFRVETTLWRDDAGEPAGYLFAAEDVTTEHAAEAARQEMAILLRAVIDHIPATIVVRDLESDTFALLNARAAGALAVDAETARGKRLSEVLRPSQLVQAEAHLRELGAEGEVRVREQVIEDGPAAGRILRLARLVFADSAGRKRLLSVGEDVTEVRQAARALETALAEARQANEAKTAFLATMSHEIRTPLNGVLGMVQAMANDPLPEVQRRRLDIVRQSGEALLAIVNDALDLSKIEAGKLELEEIDFDLVELVEGAVAGFTAMAAAKGLHLVVEASEAAGLYRGDPARVRQVISNLISNAVKFTAKGEVRVTAARLEDQLSISVADTGVGVSPEVLERLFEKFVQADRSTTRRFGGTGLGLAICRELAMLMGGTMSARSTPGRGACFTLAAPLRRVGEAGAQRAAAAAAPEIDHDLRILAAEDNPVNQEVLKTIFDQAGVDIALVEDGAAAVEAFRSQVWDLVLMDVQMPVMDGSEATRLIRDIERKTGRPRTPVIGLTADAMAHQRAAFLASGMDQVVAKPLQIAALFGAIEALLAAETTQG